MKIVIFFLLICIGKLFSQWYQAPIDTVFWFFPGKGQNLGQDSTYFPQNIFRLPDTNASENVPSSSPKDICSLGMGGEIVVGFKNYYVYDGEGPDFTIFENAFISPITKKVFAEPAVVSVSEDGVNFFEFPWDYYTLDGCAGTKPTNGKANPFDPTVSGGNAFDLAQIGLEKARYIKIKDICDTILKNPQHPFYDPLLSGFDLDCVVGLHLKPISSSVFENDNYKHKFHPELLYQDFPLNSRGKINVFNLYGKSIENFDRTSDFISFCANGLNDGLFLVIFVSENFTKFFKILKLGNEMFIQ